MVNVVGHMSEGIRMGAYVWAHMSGGICLGGVQKSRHGHHTNAKYKVEIFCLIICLFRKHSPYKRLQNIQILYKFIF